MLEIWPKLDFSLCAHRLIFFELPFVTGSGNSDCRAVMQTIQRSPTRRCFFFPQIRFTDRYFTIQFFFKRHHLSMFRLLLSNTRNRRIFIRRFFELTTGCTHTIPFVHFYQRASGRIPKRVDDLTDTWLSILLHSIDFIILNALIFIRQKSRDIKCAQFCHGQLNDLQKFESLLESLENKYIFTLRKLPSKIIIQYNIGL